MKITCFTICAGIAVAGVYFGNLLFSVAHLALGGGLFCASLGFACYVVSALALGAYLGEVKKS